MIEVQREASGEELAFMVTVREGASNTLHHVTMTPALAKRLGSDRATPEQCVEAAFRFLLDREPKESILSAFDVAVIARYFPEFDREIAAYLPAPGHAG